MKHDKGNQHKTLMIDDMRLPNFPDDLTLVTTPNEALEILRADQQWDFFYLDHDLGEDASGKTLDIWPVIEHMEKNAKALRDSIVYIISSNPVGASRMKTALDRAGYLTIIVTDDQRTLLFHYRDWVDD